MDAKRLMSDAVYLEAQFTRLLGLWDDHFVNARLVSPTSTLRNLTESQRQLLLLLMIKLWPEEWHCPEHGDWLVHEMTESLNGRGKFPLDPRGLWSYLRTRLCLETHHKPSVDVVKETDDCQLRTDP